MKTLSQIRAENEEKFEKEFTFLYGEDDPTHTFHDHDDFLIIKDNFIRTIHQSEQAIIDGIKEWAEERIVPIISVSIPEGFEEVKEVFYNGISQKNQEGKNLALSDLLQYLSQIAEIKKNK